MIPALARRHQNKLLYLIICRQLIRCQFTDNATPVQQQFERAVTNIKCDRNEESLSFTTLGFMI